jgi:hypothetical protein
MAHAVYVSDFQAGLVTQVVYGRRLMLVWEGQVNAGLVVVMRAWRTRVRV